MQWYVVPNTSQVRRSNVAGSAYSDAGFQRRNVKKTNAGRWSSLAPGSVICSSASLTNPRGELSDKMTSWKFRVGIEGEADLSSDVAKRNETSSVGRGGGSSGC